ncbi:uncharacterized protein LOC132902490 [Amyelois transitella]|uniref:uncharacterized protein LOC132902490 n=1 Tax=Amyelois transitella TaxID=680683 RepID=UPI0029901DF9|nr:uncharacterized protein LOC132902490 [Amyelois transitella]
MFIPDIVQSGSNDVTLCCQYSSFENSSVHWLFNGNKIPSSQWDSLNSFRISEIQGSASTIKQSLLTFERVTPDMSGNYTCKLNGGGARAEETKHMFVFSPENDFTLKINYINKLKIVNIECTAWGLHPRPQITLEVDNRPVPKQVQRVWWRQGTLYTAEGTADVRGMTRGKHDVTCRLYLPQADYTAIMRKYVSVGNEICCGAYAIVSNAITFSTAVIFVTFFNSIS